MRRIRDWSCTPDGDSSSRDKFRVTREGDQSPKQLRVPDTSIDMNEPRERTSFACYTEYAWPERQTAA
jgi:hypothetical protein